jgi:hypothetical protein
MVPCGILPKDKLYAKSCSLVDDFKAKNTINLSSISSQFTTCAIAASRRLCEEGTGESHGPMGNPHAVGLKAGLGAGGQRNAPWEE